MNERSSLAGILMNGENGSLTGVVFTGFSIVGRCRYCTYGIKLAK